MHEHLGQVMPSGAARYGDRVALVIGDEEFTYHRLEELTAKLANALADLGVKGLIDVDVSVGFEIEFEGHRMAPLIGSGRKPGTVG